VCLACFSQVINHFKGRRAWFWHLTVNFIHLSQNWDVTHRHRNWVSRCLERIGLTTPETSNSEYNTLKPTSLFHSFVFRQICSKLLTVFCSCEELITYVLVAWTLNSTLRKFKSKHNNGVEISMCTARWYIGV